MNTPESGPQDCQHCGTVVDPLANFCPQCGARKKDGRLCRGCGEPVGSSDGYCSHCGYRQSDPTSKTRSHGETRAAFQRRVRDHIEAGWELKDDHGDLVTLVDREIGSIPIHILLVFLTSGVGNLLYGWYHYSKLADYRYLSIGDGRQPHPPGAKPPADSTAAAERTTGITAASIGGITALVGLFFLLSTLNSAGTVLISAIGLVLLIGGIGILPPVRRRLARRHPITTFGRHKSVDHRLVHPTEGYTDPCVVCGNRGRSGLLRRRRNETVVAGVPLLTHSLNHNFYCERCAGEDRFGGRGDPDAVDEDIEVSTADLD